MNTNENNHLVDGISAIAVHNGVARIQFMRLGLDGKALPSVEVDIPVSAMRSVIEALRKIAS